MHVTRTNDQVLISDLKTIQSHTPYKNSHKYVANESYHTFVCHSYSRDMDLFQSIGATRENGLSDEICSVAARRCSRDVALQYVAAITLKGSMCVCSGPK